MTNIKRANTSGITKTGTAIPDVPDTPTIGTAVDNGNLGASVTFTAAVTGGTPASYTVTSTPGSFTGTGTTSPVTVSGLTPSTAYTFKVKAANAAGTFGPESSASNSITPLFPVVGAYDSLAAVTLSTATSTIVFSGIPTGYKHLQLRALARTEVTGDSDFLGTRFNSDYTNNYWNHDLHGNGTNKYGQSGSATGYAYVQRVATDQHSTNVFGLIILDILDYGSTNKYKTLRSLGGYDNAGSGEIFINSTLWTSTSAVTSMTITGSTGANFKAYSSFALYGVK